MELSPSIKEILYKRGIKTEEEIAEYISDKPSKTYDPFLLHHMEQGVDLILSAIDNGDKICIYGDYDADGVTSVSLLRSVLTAIGGDVTYYIPSRFDEGYGLNSDALDKIKASGADLVVTVDCGCTSVLEVEHAKKIGLEILITDHHSMKEEIPDCLLINPNHPECKYPFKSLAGVGVAFKLAQALIEVTGMDKSILTRNLDLVAIGTIGDIVPLVDENRTLVKFGVRAINISERPGLRALISKTGLRQGEIASRNISFVIVPHINAAGRMSNATLAARLLQTDDAIKVEQLADELIECNKKRRAIQDELYKKGEEILESLGEKSHCILLKLDDAHEGVIGIVAGKIKETFGLPTLIVTDIGDGQFKGTGRSIDTVDLYKLLAAHKDLFERFGGHRSACGFTIREENIPKLKEVFQQETDLIYNDNPKLFENSIIPEVIIPSDEVNLDFIRQLRVMEPFGKDNSEPMVGVNVLPSRISRMGKDEQFLRFSGKISDGRDIKCVDFTRETDHESLLRDAEADSSEIVAVGVLGEDSWNEKTYIQINIKSIY